MGYISKHASLKKQLVDKLMVLRLFSLGAIMIFVGIRLALIIKAGETITRKDIIMLIPFGILWFVIWRTKGPLLRIYRQAKNDLEFDVNGMFREYNELQSLTKAERQAIAKQQIADSERIIGTGTLRKITKDGAEDPDKELEHLLGLPKVKQKISEMNIRMEYDKQKFQDDVKAGRAKKKDKKDIISSMHMCFFGPPGTGKTTSARIMTGYLYKNGFIDENKYIETDGNFLRGQTANETTQKTTMILQAAKGKVLFIDEAYALLSSSDSQEAMATLIKTMEDERKSFVLILAGYEYEMKKLIDANPGFFSRIAHYLYFGDYTDEELCDIFSSMANEHSFYVPYETRERLTKRIQAERKRKYFGNARTMRTILDESISHHAVNLKNGLFTEEYRYHIRPEDISIQPDSEVNGWT